MNYSFCWCCWVTPNPSFATHIFTVFRRKKFDGLRPSLGKAIVGLFSQNMPSTSVNSGTVLTKVRRCLGERRNKTNLSFQRLWCTNTAKGLLRENAEGMSWCSLVGVTKLAGLKYDPWLPVRILPDFSEYHFLCCHVSHRRTAQQDGKVAMGIHCSLV